jgi:hypothetical protein
MERKSLQDCFNESLIKYDQNPDHPDLWDNPDSPFGMDLNELSEYQEYKSMAVNEFKQRVGKLAPSLTSEQLSYIAKLSHDLIAMPNIGEFKEVLYNVGFPMWQLAFNEGVEGGTAAEYFVNISSHIRCDGRTPIETYTLPRKEQNLTEFEKWIIDQLRIYASGNQISRLLKRSQSTTWKFIKHLEEQAKQRKAGTPHL